jgi:uncharacterized protein YqeY
MAKTTATAQTITEAGTAALKDIGKIFSVLSPPSWL